MKPHSQWHVLWAACAVWLLSASQSACGEELPLWEYRLTNERCVRGCIAAFQAWETVRISAIDDTCSCLGPQMLRIVIERNKDGLYAHVEKRWSGKRDEKPPVWRIADQNALHLKEKLVEMVRYAAVYEWRRGETNLPESGLDDDSRDHLMQFVFTFADGSQKEFCFTGSHGAACIVAQHCSKPKNE